MTPDSMMYRNSPDLVCEVHQAIELLIKGHLDLCFKPDAKAECYLHGNQCNLYPLGPVLQPLQQVVAPLRWFFVGVTCLDVSRMGLRRKNAGPHFIPLVIFIYERRVRQEDLGLVECTEDFEVEEMRERLGDLYGLHPIIFGPKDLGAYCERKRLFIMFFLKRTVAFVSGTNAFEQMFRRATLVSGSLSPSARRRLRGESRPSTEVYFEVEEDCEASMQQGDMFFGAQLSTIKLAMSKEARNMGFDRMEPMSWMQVLNAGNKSRLQGYLNLEPKKLEAECGVKERERWPPRVFDLSQNPTVTPRSGPRLRTLLRHSLILVHEVGATLAWRRALDGTKGCQSRAI